MVKDAQNIEVLSYGEVMELAYFGAKVLHPLAVTPLQESGIPLRVKSAADPDFPARSCRRNPATRRATPSRPSPRSATSASSTSVAPGCWAFPVIASVFDAIARENVTLLMVSQSSSMSNVSLAVQTVDAERTLVALRAGVSLELKVEVQPGVAVLAIVGSGMRGQKGVSARMFTALAEQDVNVLMISQGSSELNVSVAVEAAHVDAATLAVHRAFGLGTAATA